MDLVDIDQVLDNLELREEAEHSKAAAGSRSSPANATVKNVAVSNGIVISHPKAIIPEPSSSSSNCNSSSNSFNKSFVGVSQVFNSLDDYRKNVQTLETATPRKYDDECKLIATESVKNIRTNDNKEALVANHASPSSAGNRFKCDPISDGEADEDEDDDDADDMSNDIHKFIEGTGTKQRNYDDNEIEDLTTTTASDSLTTSSSSTFSSGPSPGFVSTADDHSTPLSAAENEDGVGAVDVVGKTDKTSLLALSEEMEQLTEASAMQDQLKETIVAASLMHQEEDLLVSEIVSNRTTGLEDLAAGLSSISINSQSELPREITVSSVLGGLLNELSDTTSASQLSQMKDYSENNQKAIAQDTDSKSSLVTPSLSFPEYDPMKKQDKQAQGGIKFNAYAVPVSDKKQAIIETFPQKFQQPVTFGSTMDEISDTELDSMLQEMDIDDADELNKDSTDLRKVDDNVTQKISYPTADDIDGIVSSVDQMNADSFSQASTVEFSEMRALQQPAIVTNEYGLPLNSISSSYSSSESSLEDDIQSTGATKKGTTNPQRRPKRPTTLDLPVMKMNLYANAGQTPPGISFTQSDPEPESSEEQADLQTPNDLGVKHIRTEDLEEIQTIDNTQQCLESVQSATLPTTCGLIPANNEEDQDGDPATSDIAEATGYSDPHANLGKCPPIWVPDNMATACMQCHVKFTMIKRRHHCRACGKVLCSVCCSQKFKLEFLTSPESRVCVQCFLILTKRQQVDISTTTVLLTDEEGAIGNVESTADAVLTTPNRSPNPNNPMEYCSTIPPHRQISNTLAANPPTVIVPVGVLKKEGSNSSNSSNSSNKKTRKRKSVMFSDGIAPGSDLASIENQWSEAKHARRQHQSEKQRNITKSPTAAVRSDSATDSNTMGLVAQLFRGSIPPIAAAAAVTAARAVPSSGKTSGDAKLLTSKTTTTPKIVSAPTRVKRLPPSGCDDTGSFIPKGDHCIPPIQITKGDNSCEFDYKDVANNFELVERLQRETLKFAVQNNFFVFVKILNLKCCMNKTVINFTTCGMHQVGNDEIIILLEYEPPFTKSEMTEPPLPKDIFVHLNEIYVEAERCNPISELSFTMPQQSNFLGSREYGGFLYIRATFQCLQDIIMPESPFLIGVLIHRNEVPWAKVFPLRLMLRLGAQYRYYPCPHISIRDRESVYAEIAQTIINFLADFRNFSYTLPSIKGMYIHMEDRQTSVIIPRNRYDDVIKAINKSSDHILAFGGNFSKAADGHLVCIQNTKDETSEMFSYSTQAINIQGQPRKVTGASFFVLNEALKSTSGLSGKCSIVEDGLMVQILPTKMEEVRNALKNTKDIEIVCGPLDADEQQTEIVSIKWVDNDRDFGIGVKSPIDSMSLEGVSGMRVHASFNYSNSNYSIRLTEIYMIKCDDWNTRIHAQDITRISEQIARSTSVALVPFLDLLAANGSFKIGLRITLHQENVCYEAGTRSTKLPPLYMNALDNHLIPTLHNESTGIEDAIILELIFYILNV